ncbi:hypothetical protein BLA29_012005 [Euroglyphus maynei]|uniref:Uncharacterized protein n=1 Tax=Euroglyphus maynei TaxID=6958 RepID=A0A1Y3BJH2_EURMA|nr:hypothetical protein BLA29_012005 [Euroglyphus maynei]
MDMISSTTFVQPSIFAKAVGASIIYPMDRSEMNNRHSINDESIIHKTAIELIESIRKTNENKFVIM